MTQEHDRFLPRSQTRLATFLTLLLASCTQGAGGEGDPMVWPPEPRLGDTVAMSIDSNYIPIVGVGMERFDLSLDNVQIEVSDGGTPRTVYGMIAPKAVFDARTPPTSAYSGGPPARPGAQMTIAVFDLPGPGSPNELTGFQPPGTVHVRLVVDGTPDASTLLDEPVYVRGGVGAPTDFFQYNEPADLQPRPTLRLRPRRSATPGVKGFDPAWPPIAALEFLLEYDPARVQVAEAYGATEGATATAFVGPPQPAGALERVHITLFDPKGFKPKPLDGAVSDGDPAGEGPLIDVVVEKAMGLGFSAYAIDEPMRGQAPSRADAAARWTSPGLRASGRAAPPAPRRGTRA